jgi:hypothetical protein
LPPFSHSSRTSAKNVFVSRTLEPGFRQPLSVRRARIKNPPGQTPRQVHSQFPLAAYLGELYRDLNLAVIFKVARKLN